jgi:hypothetical protein
MALRKSNSVLAYRLVSYLVESMGATVGQFIPIQAVSMGLSGHPLRPKRLSPMDFYGALTASIDLGFILADMNNDHTVNDQGQLWLTQEGEAMYKGQLVLETGINFPTANDFKTIDFEEKGTGFLFLPGKNGLPFFFRSTSITGVTSTHKKLGQPFKTNAGSANITAESIDFQSVMVSPNQTILKVIFASDGSWVRLTSSLPSYRHDVSIESGNLIFHCYKP